MLSRLKQWIALAAVTIILGSTISTGAAPLPVLRRVNAPYYPDGIPWAQTAVFWFGQVTPNQNYTDVRVGYDKQDLFVGLIMFDRRLWYDLNHVQANLTNYDSVTLYFNQAGNTGTTLDTAYRFDSQVNQWEARTPWQDAYKGSGTSWVLKTISYTTQIDYAQSTDTVGGFNVDQDNRGWGIGFHIPWTSLGLSGPPPLGTTWGFAIAVHDRDSKPPAAMQPDTLWPETAAPGSPATWGQLYFGTPTYTPPAARPGGVVTIRQGLNGAVVPDGAVGGGTNCGGDWTTYDYWTVWGQKNYTGVMFFDVQNESKIADWLCFSKYYVTFPLSALPANKAVISATLTLHQMGHAGAGWNPGPVTSYIQVLTVGDDWTESTLNWNNAPLPRENIAMTAVDPLTDAELNNRDPGVPRTWDVSRAAAEAYSAGQPLRLAVYSADAGNQLQTGKYFWSSDHPDTWPEARPSLTITWGETIAAVSKTVWPTTPAPGQPMTYTLHFLGAGKALTLTDNLPAQVSAPGPITVDGGGQAQYASNLRRVTWTGTPTASQAITITFPVTVTASGPAVVSNTAALADATGVLSTDTAVAMVGGRQLWLPMMTR